MTDVARSGTLGDWPRGAIRKMQADGSVAESIKDGDPRMWLLRADRYISATSVVSLF